MYIESLINLGKNFLLVRSKYSLWEFGMTVILMKKKWNKILMTFFFIV